MIGSRKEWITGRLATRIGTAGAPHNMEPNVRPWIRGSTPCPATVTSGGRRRTGARRPRSSSTGTACLVLVCKWSCCLSGRVDGVERESLVELAPRAPECSARTLKIDAGAAAGAARAKGRTLAAALRARRSTHSCCREELSEAALRETQACPEGSSSVSSQDLREPRPESSHHRERFRRD